MVFKDWRKCSQEPVNSLILDDPNKLYYLQAQAWHLKGHVGGTHSYCVFYHNEWLVVELTDVETLTIQNADIIYHGATADEHAPFISNRLYNARWFGHKPYIVDSCPAVPFENIKAAAEQYPYKKFNVLNRNCNTFTSYLIAKLDLDLRRPFRSFGFKNRNWWKTKHGIKV